jgi:iron complex transport system permease protein
MAQHLLETKNEFPLTIASYNLRWRNKLCAVIGMFIFLIFIILAALTIGSSDISFIDTCKILLNQIPFIHIDASYPLSSEIIIIGIRLPRILLAGVVGAALSVAGTVYQAVFRNPLADPYLIGVAQGATLGAIIGFMFPAIWQMASVPMLAFIGAIVAILSVYLIARVGKTLPTTTLILAGVALGAFFLAISSYLMIISGDRLHGILSWILGSFSSSNWQQFFIASPCITIGIIVIWLFARPLNIMQLDEEQAQQLGINVEQIKVILLGIASLIVATAVAFCGAIGFVGIIIPHAMRLIWGPDHRFLLPLSTFAGATFLIIADTIARTVVSPTEIPIGVITAIVGTPFFLYLLRQTKRMVF